MSLFIIPDWLKYRKITSTELKEIQELFGDKQEAVLGDLTVDLLKNFYHSHAKVDFYKIVRVLGFYGIQFSEKLSMYSEPLAPQPDVLYIASKHYENNVTDFVGMPSSALLKSLGIEMLGQLHGVPVISLKKLLDCTSSVEDFFSTIPAIVKSVTSDFFLPTQQEENIGSKIKETTLADQVQLTEEQYGFPVEVLSLSVRATNCLEESQITTIGQLMQLSTDDLLSLPNLGRKTLTELKEKIELVRTNDTTWTQLSLFSFDNKIAINLADERTLSDLSMPIENLILSVRTRTVLNEQKIEYIWQAAQLTEKDLLSFKKFGKKSLSELKDKLSELGLHLGISFTPDEIERIQLFEKTVSTQELDVVFEKIILELQSEKIPFLDERENQIVNERLWPITLNKRTLEDIASDWLISRERIRQIEKRTRKKILQQYRKDIVDIAEAITQDLTSCRNLTAISQLPFNLHTSNLRIQRIVSELFLLVNEQLYFDWKFDLVSSKGEKLINKLCQSIRKNVQMVNKDKLFSEETLKNAVTEVISKNQLNSTTLKYLLIRKVKEKENITSSGELFCFGKINKQDKIAVAFEKRFPEGLEIHKKSDYLLKCLQEFDSKSYCKSNPRSVIARLVYHPDIFLWGRGFYMHRKSLVFNIDIVIQASVWIIHRFDQGYNKFQIELVYNYFQKEMIEGGIPNEYALYTLVRTLENGRIGQRKFPSLVDLQSDTDILETVVEELDNYLLTAEKEISLTDLKKEFIEIRGWKDYGLHLKLSSSEVIYPWLNHSYIHLKYLEINYSKLDQLIDAIQNKIIAINSAYSLKGARQELQVLWHQVCPNAPISTMVKLIRGVDSTDLEINHYLVSLKDTGGTEVISMAKEIEEYFIDMNNEVSTLELKKEFQNKRGWSKTQYYSAVRNSSLFRMSKTSFVHPSTILWSPELYEELHAVLSENLQIKNDSGTPHLILSEIIDGYFLPELPNDIEWTTELLISAGGEQGDFLFFDDACVFAENAFCIEDVDDMIAFLVSQSFEYNIAKQKKVERLLWREGIILSGRSIPHNDVFFPESSITYLQDSDEITLSQIGEERYVAKEPA